MREDMQNRAWRLRIHTHMKTEHLLEGKNEKVFFAIPTRNYRGGGGHGGEKIVKNCTFCQ